MSIFRFHLTRPLILNNRILSIFSIVSVCILSSCGGGKKTENSLTEGLIEYNITVVDISHPMAGFAPSSATVKFKESKFELEMSTMGIFNTTFISNPSNQTLTQMVKFMDIKSACIQKKTDLDSENGGYELKLEETKETKKIAGYNCKKVKASLLSNPAVKFDVYYTNELGMENINELSPYRSIKGMLMQYRVKKFGLELCFTADVVKNTPVKDDAFEVPAYYKIITRKEMQELFDQLFADFKN